MTIQLAFQQLLAQLYEVYEKREAANIADMVIEHVTGQKKIDRIIYKDLPVSAHQQAEIARIAGELFHHRPIQYVLGEAWFMDMKLSVNESVLIPRPETEELVEWMVEDIRKSDKQEILLLDIGTGSGCIPIAVRKKIPGVVASAIDVSEDALQVAQLNSMDQQLAVDFLRLDFLNEEEWTRLGKYDIIVSNPPYIQQREAAFMHEHVLKHEPHLALFVADNEALIFYRLIAKFGRQHLQREGCIYAEINEAFGEAVVNLFKENGYKNVILKKDMQGKDRMVKASFV